MQTGRKCSEFQCLSVRNLTVVVVVAERGWKLHRTVQCLHTEMVSGAARIIREIKSALQED